MDSNVTLSCYSACIAKILSVNGVTINERELFKNQYLLELNYDTPNIGLCSNIELMVNDFLLCNGIKLVDIKIDSVQELNKNFLIYQGFLMNLNCEELAYSTVFENVITKQKRHYVYVENNYENNVKILDLYIPEISRRSFEGWIKLNFEKNVYYFKQIDLSQYKRWDIQEKELLGIILQKYFCSVEKGVFKEYKRDIRLIEKKDKPKEILYEMATSLSISGTIISRRLFSEIIKNNENILEKTKLEVEKIFFKYTTLRLMLLKTYIRFEPSNFMSVYKLLDEIEKEEIDAYRSIYIQLN